MDTTQHCPECERLAKELKEDKNMLKLLYNETFMEYPRDDYSEMQIKVQKFLGIE